MTAVDEDGGLEFGRFRLLPRRQQLLADGAPVELGTRAFDVLMVLLEAQGALVTKEQLLHRVWPGSVVEENNIQVQISALRKALGRDRDLILTVPLRGYRFTANVRATAAPEPKPAPEAPRPALSNLPATVSDFVGRQDELAELQGLLKRHRLVTVIGAGGIGKTRLGLEVARALLPGFADGVWLAELAPLADPELVPTAMNAALGLQSGHGRWTPERLAGALGAKRLLLVLDSCEHVIAAAASEAEALLRAAPEVHILATSQEPLGVDGECIYRLHPLDLPGEDSDQGDGVLRHDSVRLFVTRARAADPHFQLDDRVAAAVAAICRRLDGIPLAIELAAARAATLGVEGVARRLDDRFHVLTGGHRTGLPRHQTLRATLDWSHRLLAETDQRVLRRLAIFAGSFTLDAAVSVVADPAIEDWQVVERVAELVAKSLVVAAAAGPPRRYRLLDTTRAYALEKLADAGEFAALARGHAVFFRDYFQAALVAWERIPSVQWLATYAPEIDNVRAALDWSFGAGNDEGLGLRLAAVTRTLWYLLSLTQEGRARLERAIAGVTAATPKMVEAQLWYGYGFLCTGEPRGRALPAAKRCVTLCRELGDGPALGRALSLHGLILTRAGHVESGAAALEEACALLAAAGHHKSYARCLTNLAIVRMVAGRLGEARAMIEQALELGRASGADFWVLRTLVYKAEVDFADGFVERAIAQAGDVIALCRSMRRTGLRGHAQCNLAGYLIAQGAIEQARATLREALPLAHESELGIALLAGGLQHLAVIAEREQRLDRAAQLLGYAHAFFTAEFEGRSPVKQQIHEHLLESLRRSVAPAQLTQLMDAGARWTPEEALAVALAT